MKNLLFYSFIIVSLFISIPTHAQTITIGETAILTNPDNGNGDLLVSQSTTLSQTATIQSLSFYVTTASGNLRLGIYDATGPSGGPGTKKAETNSFTPVVGWNTQNVITPISLSAGAYWLAYLPSDNSLAFVKNSDASSSGKYYSFTYGIMPTMFSTTPNTTASHWSFYATLSTGPDTTPPILSNGSPSGSIPATTSTMISLSTNENATCKYAMTAGTSYASMPNTFTTTGGTSHSTTITGLSSGNSYSYYVRCQDTAPTPNVNTADYAISFSVAVPDTTPPTVPTNLSATPQSSSQINLSWTASTDNVGVTGYRVERCQGAGCSTFAQVGTPTGTTFNDTGLGANTTYRYQVRAIDGAGNLSGYSSITSATTQVALPPGSNDPYFNSAEAGCNPSSPNPNYLFCDDFADGTFIVDNGCGVAANDGWCWVSNRTLNRGQSGAGVGGAAGFIRSTMVGGSDGGLGSSIVATHGFINNPSLDEIWVRQYIRFGAGYTWNNNQKFTSGQGYPFNPGGGGIAYYGIGHDTRVMQLCPVQSCNNLNEGYLGHNQTPITMTTDRWYYMEYHVILNTVDVRNGTWELWINDCGTSGVCTGSPTLRARYTNVLYLGTGFGMYIGKIGGFFLDIWGNPSDGGNLDVDQIIVSNNGTTGFMGSTPPPTDTTSPTVSVTAPANGSTVSGTVTVSANASDNTGVSGVQFLLDGTNLGAEDTTSPYAVSWNTTTATNGSHTLTARARDAAGNMTTSSFVSVTVDNGPLVGDLNQDRTVNGADWTIMAGVWFTADAVADINKDGIVNSIDFSLMNANWGRTI